MGSVMENIESPSSTTSEGFTPFTIDPSHPLYVHLSDSPGSQLVSVPFSGCGFVLWISSMLTSLSAKNKLGFLDGRVPQPSPDSPYYPYWKRCNDMVKAWITNSVSREIATSVMCLKTTREVWKDINERFVCSCGALPKFIEDQQLFQFLNGLNESYSTVKSAITMMSHLPPISKAYSLLQQDESQKESLFNISNFSGDSASFYVNPSQYNNNKNFTQKAAWFSPDFKFTKSKKSASCVQGDVSYPQSSSRISQSPGNSAPVHGFKKEQYQHLLTIFQQAHVSPGAAPTIQSDEDSTFAHFAGLFTAYAVESVGSYDPSLKRPLVIGKAAGRLYYLHPDGDLFPNTSSSLSNVVNTTCNKSVPAPLHPNVPPSCNQTSLVNKMDLLWHQRLGHMPFHKMQSISFLSDKVSTKQSFICSICPMARQQRLPFHDSTVSSTKLFQLVHIDIWGPYNTKTYNGFRYFLTLVDDFTKATLTHLLSSKSNALSIL
ncbi:uncharacterized protein LOC142179889 [Nicotiana tabacum]|uniref:Uncharacterized protein LOC142179889 n=1 Tax=Nicotiana tabacum TaxID=4097 RepID=A0AC58UBL7_TOBAC